MSVAVNTPRGSRPFSERHCRGVALSLEQQKIIQSAPVPTGMPQTANQAAFMARLGMLTVVLARESKYLSSYRFIHICWMCQSVCWPVRFIKQVKHCWTKMSKCSLTTAKEDCRRFNLAQAQEGDCPTPAPPPSLVRVKVNINYSSRP